MKNIFSKYTLVARIFPTLLWLIPFYVLQYYYFSDVFPAIFAIKIVGNISLSLVILYLVSQFFVRFPSKLLEDFLFGSWLDFPTTKFLMFNNNEYSYEFKNKIRDKIKSDFWLDLLSDKWEKSNEKEAKLRIKEAVNLMRNHVKNWHLLLQHNIEYGFCRNLFGASVLGIFFSSWLVFFSYLNKASFMFSSMLLIVYFLYLVFGKYMIKYYANNYAKCLIAEYYNSK